MFREYLKCFPATNKINITQNVAPEHRLRIEADFYFSNKKLGIPMFLIIEMKTDSRFAINIDSLHEMYNTEEPQQNGAEVN